ncbi:MAG: hypothetical protein CBD76_02715 [Pelagibacteraceae bacterium TMED216]|nr:MAG: hypothetical protein CBD76_02715 [Pelagibacteraceae bacterium TMED216]|tara:strand:+ start:44 stop:1189 length:1146 start_codon:yes stop_codon:yes gene_type:complete
MINFLKPENKFNIKLQSPSKSLWTTFKKAFVSKKNFKSYWKKINKDNLPKDLVLITEKFLETESYDWVSKFWRHCMINHFKSIVDKTPEEALKSIILTDVTSHTYFEKKNFLNTSKKIKDEEVFKTNIFKKHDNLSSYESISYNTATLLYYNLKKKYTKLIYQEINKEFYSQYSPNIEIDDLKINQHLMYTINEIEKLQKIVDLKKKNLKILEIGAGYGRTANSILSLCKEVKYVIADIPPTIFASMSNLKKYYPNLKISSAFDLGKNHDLNNFVDQNDVTFIFPHQLRQLNNKKFDLTLMIGVSLEMEPGDIKRYMSFINNLSKNLYMKVFEFSGLPFSFYKFYRHNVRSDYFIPESWEELFNEVGDETDFMYHLGYKIK